MSAAQKPPRASRDNHTKKRRLDVVLPALNPTTAVISASLIDPPAFYWDLLSIMTTLRNGL